MAEAKDVLLQQLSACHNVSGWFTSLQDALKGVTFEQATWTADGKLNSIWSMVQHLAYWSEVFLEKYKPGAVGDIESIENHMTFHIREELTEDNWDKAIARIEKVYIGWREAIKENPEKLDDKDMLKAVAGYSVHNAYHIGQIVTNRKLQGNWADSGL